MVNMQAYLTALVLAAVVCTQAGGFNNPILPDGDLDYNRPSAIKVNGTYYLATATYDAKDKYFSIHASTDLVNWTPEGYVFDSENAPEWSSKYSLGSPQLHQIGTDFLVYFSATREGSNHFVVGVATASHPLGPYTSIDRPLVELSDQNAYYPTLIKDGDKQYLAWSNTSNYVNGRQLNDNGLSFTSGQSVELLGGSFLPWHIRRGSFHYLMYAANGGCHVGVARSTNAVGPYEKLSNLIIVPNSEYDCTEAVSVVKDEYDENYVIFISVRVHATSRFNVALATVGWDDNEWPFVGEF